MAGSWSPPADTGGSAITQYRLLAFRPDQSAAGYCQVPASSTTCTVTGLTNGTVYTLKVRAWNSVGYGPLSAASAGVTAGVPGAPAAPSGAAGNHLVVGSWSPPGDIGGGPITQYRLLAFRPDQSAAGYCQVPAPTTTCAITGLTNGTAYTLKVRAWNSVGFGPFSPASGPVTPVLTLCSSVNESTAGYSSCDVPAGVTALAYTVKGGNGGNGGVSGVGGQGAKVVGTLPVTPGQTLYLTVGGNGANGGEFVGGSGGGGYSAVSLGSLTAGPLVVAGGGGGAGYDKAEFSTTNGGAGGTSGPGGGGAGGSQDINFASSGQPGGTASTGGVGGSNGGAGGAAGVKGGNGANWAGAGGGGFGALAGLPGPEGSSALGGFPGAGGPGAGDGGGGGGGYGGGGGGGDPFHRGGGGGGGASLVPGGAVATVTAQAPWISLTPVP